MAMYAGLGTVSEDLSIEDLAPDFGNDHDSPCINIRQIERSKISSLHCNRGFPSLASFSSTHSVNFLPHPWLAQNFMGT